MQRGPGTAPKVLGKESQDVELSRLERLESRDLSDSLPGDLLQLQNSEHEVNKTARGLRSGGVTKSSGTGGDRIWKDALMPDEKKAIRNFFK